MGWIGRAFGRALIYNGVRDVFYASHQAGRQRSSTSRRHQVQEVYDIIIRYKCAMGHEFTRGFNRRVDEKDERARYPEWGHQAIWRCIDVHGENPGV